MSGKVYIGTSGWNYKSWRHSFYGDTPQKQWLRFCAQRFTAIEVNGTFYRLQEKTTYKKWRENTPAGVLQPNRRTDAGTADDLRA